MQMILGGSQSSNICYSTFNTTKNVACFGEDRCCCYDDTYHASPTCCSCTSYWWLYLIITLIIISTTASLITLFIRRNNRLKLNQQQQQPSLQTVMKNLQQRYQAPIQRRVQQRPYENRPYENIRSQYKYVPPSTPVSNKIEKKPVQVKEEKVSSNQLIRQQEKVLQRQQKKGLMRQQEKKEVVVKSYEVDRDDPQYKRLQERDALFNKFLQRKSMNSQDKKSSNK